MPRLNLTDIQPVEIKAMRETLNISQPLAAQYIGRSSVRSWQHWEKGSRRISEVAANNLMMAVNFRRSLIEKVIKDVEENDREFTHRWFDTFDEFKVAYPLHNELYYCAYQSVVAHLYSAINGHGLSEDGIVHYIIHDTLSKIRPKQVAAS